MYPRTNYEMTQSDLDKLLDACKPVPCMLIGGVGPSSPQENANRAWAELGSRMGFDHMTVQPKGSDPKCFTAVPNEPEEAKAARLAKEAEELRLARIKELETEIEDKKRRLVELTAEK